VPLPGQARSVVKVVDFGMSKIRTAGQPLTGERALVGTAAYGLVLLTAMASARRRPEGVRASTRQAAAPIAAVAVFAVGGALFDVLSFPHVTYTFFFVLGLICVGPVTASKHERARPG